MKPLIGPVVVPLLLVRRWRWLAIMLTTVAVATASSFAFVGLGQAVTYFARVLPELNQQAGLDLRCAPSRSRPSRSSDGRLRLRGCERWPSVPA